MFITQKGSREAIMSAQGTFSQLLGAIMNAFSPTSGTATRAYTFNEIVFAKLSNMINNPIGIGVMLSILIIVGLIAFILNYKKLLSKEYDYMWITLLSSIYTFLGFKSSRQFGFGDNKQGI